MNAILGGPCYSTPAKFTKIPAYLCKNLNYRIGVNESSGILIQTIDIGMQMEKSTLLKLSTRLIDQNMVANDKHYSPLPNLTLVRHFAPTKFESTIYDPVACLILQGSKETTMDKRTYHITQGDFLIISHDLSVSARIKEAGKDRPYMALILNLDIGLLRSLYDSTEVFEDNQNSSHSIDIDRIDDELADTLKRYLKLADSSADAAILGPLILKELHYRLLSAPNGGMLRRLMWRNSHASQILFAIKEIRQNFKAPLSVPKIASAAGMGVSSFHTHFKDITGTTPLQYQKDLRLIDAQQILNNGYSSVSSTAYEVGYESPTQFSREYKRKFGYSPSANLKVANNLNS